MSSLELSERDQAMLAGKQGPATALAMSIMTRFAAVCDAPTLFDVTQVHIDGCIYEGEAGLEFAEKLASWGGRVAVPTTLNISSLDQRHWQEFGVPEEWAAKAGRLMKAYVDMGCIPTWTCAPYQAGLIPKFGQQIAWAESNAIVFANSVIGARTNRYGDLIDICAALTGRAPLYGLHLTENRRGQILFRLSDIPPALFDDDSFYPVFGYLIGRLTGERIPVIEGVPERVPEDGLKAFGAAAASSGSVALFHMVGITPEAPTREAAFQGAEPEEIIDIHLDQLCEERKKLSTTEGQELDTVVLGSPHFSVAEFRQLVALLTGLHCHPNVKFIITSSRAVCAIIEKMGLVPQLRDFGVQITVDTCILNTPMLRPETRVLMTNSAKYAHYVPGRLGLEVVYGSMADCVRSAVEERVTIEEGSWKTS